MGRRSREICPGGAGFWGAGCISVSCNLGALQHSTPPVTPMSSFHTGEGLMMGNEGVVGARRPLWKQEGSGHYISCVRTGGGAGSRSGGRGRRNILAWESLFFHLCWWRMLFSKELVVLGWSPTPTAAVAGGQVLWCSRSGRRCREQPRWGRFPSSRFPVPPPQEPWSLRTPPIISPFFGFDYVNLGKRFVTSK